MDAWHTLKCDIYEFNVPRNWCYRYITFQWWCGSPISFGNSTGNATESWILVRMHMANEQYQLHVYIVWNFTRLITRMKIFFLRGGHSVPMYLSFGAVYWSLGRRGYFIVSNVAPVLLLYYYELPIHHQTAFSSIWLVNLNVNSKILGWTCRNVFLEVMNYT